MHVTGRPRTVEVRLYTDVNHLRGAATRFNSWSGEKGTFADTVGLCHGFTRGHFDADGAWREDVVVSIIRLAETHLTPLIISHEVAHAAQHIYGLDHDDERPIAEHMHSGNEAFAHLYGELFAGVWGIFNPTTLTDTGTARE